MQAYLNSLDVIPEDATMLFPLLDLDASGHIERTELVLGCMRLYGSATHLEFTALAKEMRDATDAWFTHKRLVEELLREMCSQRGIQCKF